MRAKILITLFIIFAGIGGTTYAIKNAQDNTASLFASGASSPPPGGCSCCTKKQKNNQENSVEHTRKLALEYYAGTYGDADISVDIKDFGCHMEASIIKGGAVVKRLSIAKGFVTEIG